MTNAPNLFSPDNVNKQEIVPLNDQADPQPGQRQPSSAKTAQTIDDAKLEALPAVGSSALLGDFSEQTRKQSIKDLGASWLPLGATALEATKSLHELELLISRPRSNSERVDQ